MTRMIPCITCLACTIMGIVDLVDIVKDEKIRRWHNVKVFSGYILAFIAIITSTIVEFIHPVSDIVYWGVGFASLGLVALSLLSVVYYHNCMSSRKLPQFNHMGGDDHA